MLQWLTHALPVIVSAQQAGYFNLLPMNRQTLDLYRAFVEDLVKDKA